MVGKAPRGYNKPIRQFTGNANFGESKIQGRGESDPELASMLEALVELVKAKHLKADMVDGFVRALAVSKQKGLLEALKSVESYQERLKAGELGEIPAVKAVADIRSMLEGKTMGAVNGSFY